MGSKGWIRSAMSLVALGALGLAAHCGSSDDSVFGGNSANAPCNSVYKDQCGTACTGDDACGGGLYCGTDGKCTADCANGAATCSDGLECSARGRCSAGDTDSTFGDTGPGTGGGGGDACVDLDVSLGKVEPTVLLLIDQSGSMTATDFKLADGGTTDRWTGMRDALLDPQASVIKQLQADVNFGAAFYTWDGKDISTCPQVDNVNFAINNFQAISAEWSKLVPVNNTPTGDSIRKVTGVLDGGVLAPTGLATVRTDGPKILVLITDGDPDSCLTKGKNEDPSQAIAVAATQDAFKAGIKTYVIAVSTEIQPANQQQIANAGLGLDPKAGKAPYYLAQTQSALATAFNNIIVGARSCTFTLNGNIEAGQESKGSVSLNGGNLPYNDPNGWKVNSPTEVEVTGTACTTIKTQPDANLKMSFPCGSFTPGIPK